MNADEQKFKDCVKLFEAGNYNGSLDYALQLKNTLPENKEVLLMLVRNYYFLNDFVKAENYLKKLITTDARDSGYYSLLAQIQKHLGKIAEAEENYLKSINLQPLSPETFYNLGILYSETGNYEKASLCFCKSVSLDKNFYKAYYNYGNVLRKLKEYKKAAEAYRNAIRIKPDYEDALYNMGVVSENDLDFKEAEESYKKVLQINPGNLHAKWNFALINLLKGNYKEGFENYECRLQKPEFARKPKAPDIWKGEPLEGKKILVYCEQGFGDSIQFIRFLKYLKKPDVFIGLETREELLELFANFEGIDELAGRNDSLKNNYDYECSLLSLPFLLQSDEKDFAVSEPYLIIPVNKEIEKKVNAISGFKIGIVWRGNPSHIRDEERSADISLFTELKETEGVSLISLQKGVDEKIIQKDLELLQIPQIGKNFLEIAQTIKNLDLVITVDTAIAHLAGAMCVPVWTLIPAYPDWRWGILGDKTIWYPTMKLFRQNKRGCWQEVFQKINEELLIIKNQRGVI